MPTRGFHRKRRENCQVRVAETRAFGTMTMGRARNRRSSKGVKLLPRAVAREGWFNKGKTTDILHTIKWRRETPDEKRRGRNKGKEASRGR